LNRISISIKFIIFPKSKIIPKNFIHTNSQLLERTKISHSINLPKTFLSPHNLEFLFFMLFCCSYHKLRLFFITSSFCWLIRTCRHFFLPAICLILFILVLGFTWPT
jgi:hypothetical protein